MWCSYKHIGIVVGAAAAATVVVMAVVVAVVVVAVVPNGHVLGTRADTSACQPLSAISPLRRAADSVDMPVHNDTKGVSQHAHRTTVRGG